MTVLPALISHLKLDSIDIFPLSLFTYLNDIMYNVYPQQEALSAVLDIFRALTTLVERYSTSHLLNLLSTMSDGLSIWICDESLLIPDDDFNDKVCFNFTSNTSDTHPSSADYRFLLYMPRPP